MTTEKQPRKSSGLLFFILSCVSAFLAFKAISEPFYIFAAIALSFIASIYRAFQQGIINESMAILRIIATFALAWFLAETVGQALGLPGFFATMTGFYLTFFVTFIVTGKIIVYLRSDQQPSIVEKLLGGFVGCFEGILMAWLIVITVSTIPGSQLQKHYPGFFTQFTRPVENMLAPVLPEQAGDAVKVMKSAQRIAQNFKPEKVDRAALQEILTPIAEMPEIAELQNDQSVREMVEKKDFAALIGHPALRKLLESPELQQKIKNMDWAKLEQALAPAP